MKSSLICASFLAGITAFTASVRASSATLENGLPAEQKGAGGALDASKAMMWKYVAACALRPDQALSNPKDHKDGPFPGKLGLAPEWLGGACDDACRQKVSACLLALTNRTGKHVELSLVSAAPGMNAALRPSDSDRAFPYQEGAFFGDVFRGTGYVCHGRDERKAPQVKRFCVAEPATCDGIFTFNDVGKCQDACTLTCTRLPDGSERCPAAQCRGGDKTWNFPLTTYLANTIEAGNADRLTGATSDDTQALLITGPATARYEGVDFGPVPTAHRTLVITGTTSTPLPIKVTSKGKVLGAGTLQPNQGETKIPLDASTLAGPHPLELRLQAKGPAKLATIELR